MFAFASASYIPYRHGAVCAAGTAHTDCWFNGIAALASNNGGQTFHYLGDPPGHLPFPPQAAYRPDIADPPGYMTATNFVTWRGALYSILWRRGEHPGDPPANCLVRAAIANPLHWEAWSRSGFTPIADFVNGRWEARAATCAAIDFRSRTPIRGIVLDPSSQTFIAVFQYRDSRRNEQGFYTATSSDLVAWSKPEKLLAVALSSNDKPPGIEPAKIVTGRPGHDAGQAHSSLGISGNAVAQWRLATGPR